MRYPNDLRTRRTARGLTQWAICRATDIPPDRYGRLERGLCEPSLEDALRLAQFFDVAALDIFAVALKTSAA
jgi:transcriptional regulator with XRE-family HTH domain